MKIPIPGFDLDVNNKRSVSLVTLGFHDVTGTKWLDYRTSVEEFGAERDDRWVRQRVPELDTQKYVAFHDAWTGTYAKQAPPSILARSSEQYTFISKNIKGSPRQLSCQTVLDIGDAHHKLRCDTTIAFLAERYPREPSGRYQYTISFDLPGTEIDAVAEIGEFLRQTISGWLESSATAK